MGVVINDIDVSVLGLEMNNQVNGGTLVGGTCSTLGIEIYVLIQPRGGGLSHPHAHASELEIAE